MAVLNSASLANNLTVSPSKGGKSWAISTTGATTTMTFAATSTSTGVATYINGNQVSYIPPKTAAKNRRAKKRYRQVSTLCTRKNLKSHGRCTGMLYDNDRKAADGLFCACICHPDPEAPGRLNPDWLQARKVWEAARKALDLSIQGDPAKTSEAARLSIMRRHRERR